MISKLTKEQQDLVPVYLKKWLDVGHRTTTINQEKAKECANFLYADILNKSLPKYYIFLDSPMQVNLALNMLKMDKEKYSQLSSQLSSQLHSQLSSQLSSQLHSQLRSQLHSQLSSQLSSQLYSQLRSQLDSQLSSQLDSQLYSQLYSQLGSQKMEYFYETRGNWWQSYYFHYDFILNELFKEKTTKSEFIRFNNYIQHMKNIHMIYMFDDICFFSDFPKEINVNLNSQLHCDNNAALLYRDGYSLFKLNGITVPESIVKKSPNDFTKEDITKEENADVRREIIRKIGNDRLIKLLDYVIIDTFEEYKLIAFDIGDGRSRPFLHMSCPSTNLTHILGVPPEITKTIDGLAFLFNQKEYKRPIKEDVISRDENIDNFKDGQTIFRHGDVNFKKYSGNINNIVNIENNGIIHVGNNNNHEYAFGLFEVQEVNGKKIVVLLDESTIDHNEHGKQTHPIGTYEVDIAQEYDHWLEESRKVID